MTSTKSKKKRKPISSLLSRRKNGHLPSSSSSSSTTTTNPPLPSKLSRTLIRSHHTTQKRLSQAIQQNDTTAIAELTSKLSSSGGLEAYQRASVSGQSSKRGGDSSKILVDWFIELGIPKPTHKKSHSGKNPNSNGDNNSSSSSANSDGGGNEGLSNYRLLEIGCLSPTNTIHSYFPKPQRTLMDLNSLHPDEILKQDFMEFPVPKLPDDGYDIISCSLVLNYVPTPSGRGDMLKHITSFMEQALERRRKRLKSLSNNSTNKEPAETDDWSSTFPAMFLVLPAPCVTNSRYLTEDRLQEIMISMGYEMVRRKLSPKLVYYLWKFVSNGSRKKFKKTELLPGGKRNNFAIVVE
ncbi:hypothetical protein TWF788_005115 [Orbilia oligospora]|uniref:25S rRNA adenine-N(1) methyltransferase n=1 Tax=Orbilia oligospora TaxID=2813651 RepID=A0A7C8PH55_ORBOL|nr:hypothetical protein TWF788_005115 [Orbilia oligospora]